MNWNVLNVCIVWKLCGSKLNLLEIYNANKIFTYPSISQTTCTLKIVNNEQG